MTMNESCTAHGVWFTPDATNPRGPVACLHSDCTIDSLVLLPTALPTSISEVHSNLLKVINSSSQIIVFANQSLFDLHVIFELER